MNSIGGRIRTLRRRQNRTQLDIATQSGFTKSLLCKIEKGETVPPVGTLARIAQALGVNTSALLGEDGERKPVCESVEQKQPAQLSKTAKGYRFHPFANTWPSKAMQPYYFVLRKGEIQSGPLSHAGEEFVYVLSGSVRYRVGSVEHLLNKGDSLYFDSLEEHDFTPVSDVVEFLAIFVEQPARASVPARKGRR